MHAATASSRRQANRCHLHAGAVLPLRLHPHSRWLRPLPAASAPVLRSSPYRSARAGWTRRRTNVPPQSWPVHSARAPMRFSAAPRRAESECHSRPLSQHSAAAERHGSRPARSPPGNRNGLKLATRCHAPGLPCSASPPHSVSSSPKPTPSQVNVNHVLSSPPSNASAEACA